MRPGQRAWTTSAVPFRAGTKSSPEELGPEVRVLPPDRKSSRMMREAKLWVLGLLLLEGGDDVDGGETARLISLSALLARSAVARTTAEPYTDLDVALGAEAPAGQRVRPPDTLGIVHVFRDDLLVDHVRAKNGISYVVQTLPRESNIHPRHPQVLGIHLSRGTHQPIPHRQPGAASNLK